MNETKKFKVVTLGCRTNQYESQAYIDQLKKLGYQQSLETEAADLCIVNTCTVTASADSSSRAQIRQLSKDNPEAQIVVTGCLAERSPKEMWDLPKVTHVVSNKEKEDLLSIVLPDEQIPEFKIENFSTHTRAFVKVQDGCNSFCTYCIIPYVRGRSRSRKMNSILQEIKGLVKQGKKEVVLTGINIGDYDGAPEIGEKPTRLSDLIKEVDQIEGLERIRVSSIDADEVDEDLANAILLSKKTCPSMHIVLQSGSNHILKRMNRKYTKEIFINTINYLKNRSPHFTFTTDIIVGFPGETDFDFEQTLETIRTVKFAKVHMFPYSPRERTRAALFTDRIPLEVMQQRKQEVLRLSEQIAFDLRREYVGQYVEVLLESVDPHKPGYIFGHTNNFLPVYVSLENNLKSNDLIQVLIKENTPEGLIGLYET
ncbi:MAG: tRNA (N(6)-L-threonylcarbamoyladenosine(37)-C(2))-methylthiotransferase MtaB [Rhabdochlamydiaceae bacterium]